MDASDLKNVLKYVNVRSMTDEDYESYLRLMKCAYKDDCCCKVDE